MKLPFPPRVPDGASVVTDSAPEFLRRPEAIAADVAVASTSPTVEFLYYPGQDYEGQPWSNWGDGCAVAGKYYSAIGDNFDETKLQAFPAGTFYFTPANTNHFSATKDEEVIIQESGEGPESGIKYVNPADDPRAR